jgi:hypothetical protein
MVPAGLQHRGDHFANRFLVVNNQDMGRFHDGYLPGIIICAVHTQDVQHLPNQKTWEAALTTIHSDGN